VNSRSGGPTFQKHVNNGRGNGSHYSRGSNSNSRMQPRVIDNKFDPFELDLKAMRTRLEELEAKLKDDR
jgi:hypothetical protein